MSDWNKDTDAFLDGVDGIEEPSAEARARGKIRLLAAIGGATAAGAVSAASVASASAATGSSGMVAGGTTAAATGGVAAGGVAAGGVAAGGVAAGGAASVGGAMTVGGGLALGGAALAKPLAVLLLVGGAAFSVPWTDNASEVSAVAEGHAARAADRQLGTAVVPSVAERPAEHPAELSAPEPADLPRAESAAESFAADFASEPTELIAASPRSATRAPASEPTEPIAASPRSATRAPASEPTEPIAASPRSATRVPARTRAASEPVVPEPDGGASLLRRAVALQHDGDHAGALRVANAHRERFPDSVLHVEREAVAVGALCQLGRGEEARAREQAMRGQQEATYLATRIRRYCD